MGGEELSPVVFLNESEDDMRREQVREVLAERFKLECQGRYTDLGATCPALEDKFGMPSPDPRSPANKHCYTETR